MVTLQSAEIVCIGMNGVLSYRYNKNSMFKWFKCGDTITFFFAVENLKTWMKNKSKSPQLSTCLSLLVMIMNWRLRKLHLIGCWT